jgi:uncharacterized protein YndB with AHSA1/START domain
MACLQSYTRGMSGSERPGDELLPDANLVFNRSRTIPAPADAVWPWLLQLGKDRAGWYMPGAVERLVPRRRRGSRRLEDRWQGLSVGDQIPDYGGRNARLEVVRIEPSQLLVYRDERRGAPFTWAISLTPREVNQTDVQLRFRGRLQSTGLKRWVLRALGHLLDALSGELMLRGLEERVSDPVGDTPGHRQGAA